MIKEALEHIAAQAAANRFGESDGAVFDKPVYRPPLPTAPPLAKTLVFSTLRGLAEYVRASPNGVAKEFHLLHVISPFEVQLVGAMEEFHRRREVEAAAQYQSPASFLDQWVDLETAVVCLMAVCTGEGDRDHVLETLKSIAAEAAEIRDDDGLSQKVTTKQGIHVKGTTTTKNPVQLAPFRCFPGEVDQPLSPFILRLRGSGGAVEVLFKTADGSSWKVAAAESVARTLNDYLAGAENAPAILY